jgi:hypothetical protein
MLHGTRARKETGISPVRQARAELEWLRARYDSGVTSDAIYAIIRQLETDIAWAQHERDGK